MASSSEAFQSDSNKAELGSTHDGNYMSDSEKNHHEPPAEEVEMGSPRKVHGVSVRVPAFSVRFLFADNIDSGS